MKQARSTKKTTTTGRRRRAPATNTSQLVHDPKNARRHTERNLAMLIDSLKEVGPARSIVIDESDTVLAGNAMIEAAQAAGIKKLKVIEADGQTVIAVRRRGLSNEQKVRLALYDNRTAELAEWDPEVLAELNVEDLLSGLFNAEELDQLLDQAQTNGAGAPLRDQEPKLDRAAELRRQWATKRGQLWQVGPHRLLIGDATEPADVARVLGQARPALMVTDPPYGVDYDATWRVATVHKQGQLAGQRGRNLGAIANDDRFDWSAAYKLFPGAVAYVWYLPQRIDVGTQLLGVGFELRAQIVWRKPNFVISRGHYHAQHEGAFYAVRKGQHSGWIGDHSQSTVWEIASLQPMGRSTDPHDAASGHGNQKPLECMARPLRNHAGDVYDPFVGSGTTLIAAQNFGRQGYAIDIAPEYAAVTLERLHGAFPELKIELLEPPGGKRKK